MTHISADRVKETTTTTGTGALTLGGAATGFRTFASQMATSDTCFYCISTSSGAEWEVGLGTLGSPTFARTTVLSSSNANSLVSFSVGTKDVFITAPAARLNTFTNELAQILPNVGTSTDPSTPASGFMAFYAKQIAGRMFPKVKGPSGLDYPLQASFWQNNIVLWQPTALTTGLWIGTAGSSSGTFSNGIPTLVNIYTQIKRAKYANVITTANQLLGQRSTELMYYRGNGTSLGGFFFYTRVGFDTWTNGGRFFAGMSSNATGAQVTQDPSTLNNACGFCVDAADNGAISFMTRDATAVTKASTGLTITSSNVGYDLYMFCAPNSSAIGWRIVPIVSGSEASGSATVNLPVSSTALSACVLASNAALTPATSINLGINRIYVETDY